MADAGFSRAVTEPTAARVPDRSAKKRYFSASELPPNRVSSSSYFCWAEG